MTVVTDYLAHRFWYAEHVDRWFVPADPTAERLRRWGYDDDRVVVSGLPVRPCWHERQDPSSIREDLSLPADRPIVLLSGGVRFTCGPIAEIAKLLVRRLDVHVVVLAGRNEKLLEDLRCLPETPSRITPLPFTERATELAEAASAMVTKGGGVTTSECVVKGLPLVLMPPVPGQEQSNAEYFRHRRAARIGRSRREIIEHVRAVLEDPSARGEMIASQRRLARRGAEAVAESVCQALGIDDARSAPQPLRANAVRTPPSRRSAIR
jgi:processive 1,2-diacylglycerol beta-glucosyltransferase